MKNKDLITDRLEVTKNITEMVIRSISNSERSPKEILQMMNRIYSQLNFISERVDLESQD